MTMHSLGNRSSISYHVVRKFGRIVKRLEKNLNRVLGEDSES
jgi:hypothetical protein